MKHMSIYTIVRRADQPGFDISVIGDEGVRHTMLGFKTEADAEAWIQEDKRRGIPSTMTNTRSEATLGDL
jgi:hypothetical protein